MDSSKTKLKERQMHHRRKKQKPKDAIPDASGITKVELHETFGKLLGGKGYKIPKSLKPKKPD